MKIKIALIPSENVSDAQNLTVKLKSAMEAGEMSVVDKISEALLLLTDKDHSLSLSERYWHQLIEAVRCFDEDFKSDYLMAKPHLNTIIASGVAGSFRDVVSVIEQAMRTDGIVLQLPFEEEGADV